MKFLLILFLTISKSYSFDSKKCNEATLHFGLGTGLISSVQFTSSWGGCSIFVKSAEEDKKRFFTNNFEKIRTNSAQGQGEYLMAYFDLLGCREEGRELMTATIQKNYKILFGQADELLAIDSLNRMDNLLKQELLIFRRCSANSQ